MKDYKLYLAETQGCNWSFAKVVFTCEDDVPHLHLSDDDFPNGEKIGWLNPVRKSKDK